VLSEIVDIDDDKPASRSWTDIVEEELEEEETRELEKSLSSQLTLSQPQIVVSHSRTHPLLNCRQMGGKL
jgi:hypothetical protein